MRLEDKPIISQKRSPSSFALTASVRGCANPQTVICPERLQNGEFLIAANDTVAAVSLLDAEERDGWTVVGDGVEEHTWWTFDFTKTPEWARILAIQRLCSVKLEMKLLARPGVYTDELRWTKMGIDGEPIREPFEHLLENAHHVVTFNVLSYLPAEEFASVLFATPVGQFGMHYADDALVYEAKMTIEGKAYLKN